MTTLAEAARSLGASWFTVMWRVILPNVRTAVLSASFLAVAVVLGEFTIASLLSRTNLQTAINSIGKRDSQMAVAVSFASSPSRPCCCSGSPSSARASGVVRGADCACPGAAPLPQER